LGYKSPSAPAAPSPRYIGPQGEQWLKGVQHGGQVIINDGAVFNFNNAPMVKNW
jgi:hypothetical protein